MQISHALRTLALPLTLAGPLAAQTVYEIDGATDDNAGRSVACAGDVDADGVDDFVVSFSREDSNGTNSGGARVYSGIDGSLLHHFPGPGPGASAGSAVDGAGDVNADGRDDIIVGASNASVGGVAVGQAFVYSGLDGSLLYTVDGPSATSLFGNAVSGAGDVDSDGHADFMVGAPGASVNGASSGSAFVYSGIDGSQLYAVHGAANLTQLGTAVDSAGDVNGDSFDDVLVGEFQFGLPGPITGRVLVLSGSTGAVLWEVVGSPGFGLGRDVAGAGDLNGDGFDDFVASASASTFPIVSPEVVHVYSGIDAAPLFDLEAFRSWDLGTAFTVLATGRDFDGDGTQDIGVGAKNYVRVFSGVDGSPLVSFGGGAGTSFGFAIDFLDDYDGDGQPEVIVGDSTAAGQDGRAVVLSAVPVGTSYCGPAVPNSGGGSAIITAIGSVFAAEDSLTISALQLPANQFGFFLNSPFQDFIPTPGISQGNICLGFPIGRHFASAGCSSFGGALALELDLSALPRPMAGPVAVMAGDTWNFTCWYRDQNPMSTSNFTDGLSILFQ